MLPRRCWHQPMLFATVLTCITFNSCAGVSHIRAAKPAVATRATSVAPAQTVGLNSAAPLRALRQWQSTLFTRTMDMYKLIEHSSGALVEPEGSRRFDLFDPFLKCPNGNPPERFGGAADGGKLVCADILAAPGCVVYSLGSNGDFSFEEDVLARTQCTVTTFDCTSTEHTLGARHKFVNKCLGSQARMVANPASWITLEAAMESLGHAHLSLLKIDVEGAEYDVLSAWAVDAPGLPQQIAMELHYDYIYYGMPSFRNSNDVSNLLWPLHKMRLTDLALFMSHLAGAGYGIVSREDNEFHPHCSEISLVRVHTLSL